MGCALRSDQYFRRSSISHQRRRAVSCRAGATLVGIDSYNIDDTADLSRPAHTILLGAGIPIVEHMSNLEQLPDSGFRFLRCR
jgi:kynurenine formamidase